MDTWVIGLGGNALMNPKRSQSFASETHEISSIAKSIAKLSKRHRIVVTHGNGTQVGDELLKNLACSVEPLPLYILSAETQASIGSVLETAFNSRKPSRQFCTILTHVEVDTSGSAFKKPTKQIGPFYTRRELERELGKEKFSYVEERGAFRRVVPSPRPETVLELEVIKHTLSRFNVICGGGGGVPMAKTKTGYEGVNAVVDKDYTTQLIANGVGASRLLLLTNAEYVYRNYGDSKSAIKSIKATELKRMLDALEAGTIRPKAEAAANFVENGGKLAQIGSIGRFYDLISGKSGTTVVR
ncbi:MAG: carbamate kinase [Candidatus Micrarchaeia archaeon]